MTKREWLSTTEIEQYITIDIVNEIALSALRIGESKNIICILVSIDIRSSEDSIFPGAGQISADTLGLGENSLRHPPSKSGQQVILPGEFPLKNNSKLIYFNFNK